MTPTRHLHMASLMVGCFAAIPAPRDLRADRNDDDSGDAGADVTVEAATGKEAEGADSGAWR